MGGGGGVSWADQNDPTVDVIVQRATTFGQLEAATHGCYLRLSFQFPGTPPPTIVTVNVTSLLLTEVGENCPPPLISPSAVSGPSAPFFQGQVWKWYFLNSVPLLNATYNLRVEFEYSIGMNDLVEAAPVNLTFRADNLIVVSATDGVPGAESGFCLFDPDDSIGGKNIMRVNMTLADYYLAGLDNSTTITVRWHDPVSGQTLREVTGNLAITGDPGDPENGTAIQLFTWDGLTSGQTVAKGAYPYTAYSSQPAGSGITGPVHHWWHSPYLTVSNVTARWVDENSVHIEWDLGATGSISTSGVEILAISPDLVVYPFSAPGGTGHKETAIALQIPEGGNEGNWFFLVRAKDNDAPFDRAHEDRYAQVKGAHTPPTIVTYQLNRPLNGGNLPGFNTTAAEITAICFSARSYAVVGGGEIPQAAQVVTAFEGATVFATFSHGDASGGLVICDDLNSLGATSGLLDGQSVVVGLAGHNAPRLKLALFYGCWTADDNFYELGNLISKAETCGAECAIGWNVEVLDGAVADHFASVFWAHLLDNSVSAASAVAAAVQSCQQTFNFTVTIPANQLVLDSMHQHQIVGSLEGGAL